MCVRVGWLSRAAARASRMNRFTKRSSFDASGRQHLQTDDPVQARVMGPIDGPHGALAHHGLHPVVGEGGAGGPGGGRRALPWDGRILLAAVPRRPLPQAPSPGSPSIP